MCVGSFGIFFFQAEDGIRDLVRSRGLGDVYKRQTLRLPVADSVASVRPWKAFSMTTMAGESMPFWWPVSYTHLTLPTSDLGEISVVAVSLKKKKA